ncbi:MAG: energy transducer TonB [Rhodocyclaceae bacterium]|jgi:protein TonB|nr:energy transducer TonB [Rhodocyclaceae bacterium]
MAGAGRPGAAAERWIALAAIVGLHAALLSWLMHTGLLPRQKMPEVLHATLILPEPPKPQAPPPEPSRPLKRTSAPPVTPVPATVISAAAEAASPVAVAPRPPVVEAPVAPVAPPRFDADYLDNPKPAYPPLSRRLGEEGKVILRVFVEPGGRPSKVEIQTSSGFPRLDEAAGAAVSRWRFVPARRGEEPVAAWVRVPIVFALHS